MIKITKKAPASRGNGRGMDAAYTPAQYYIEQDGNRLGVIFGSETRRGRSPEWEVFEYQTDAQTGEVTGLKALKRFFTFQSFRAGIYEGSPFKQAKEFAAEYFTN